MIKAIIFDFDGVLVESVDIKGSAFGTLYEHEGAAIQKQVMDYHNANGGVTRHDKIRYYEEKLLGRSVSDADIQRLADQFGEIVERKVIECPWVPGALDFLKTYGAEMPLYVASATPEEELRRIVEGRGALSYFKEVLGTPIKKKDHIARVLKENNWSPDDIAMIGDAMTDYDAAKANGVPFIGRVAGENPFPPGTKIIPDLTTLAVELEIA